MRPREVLWSLQGSLRPGADQEALKELGHAPCIQAEGRRHQGGEGGGQAAGAWREENAQSAELEKFVKSSMVEDQEHK